MFDQQWWNIKGWDSYEKVNFSYETLFMSAVNHKIVQLAKLAFDFELNLVQMQHIELLLMKPKNKYHKNLII